MLCGVLSFGLDPLLLSRPDLLPGLLSTGKKGGNNGPDESPWTHQMDPRVPVLVYCLTRSTSFLETSGLPFPLSLQSSSPTHCPE